MATLDRTSSSAVFSTGSSTYDVFVSFRGDTRYNFTSFLIRALKNRGINVFSDTKDLWNGEAIDPALLRAIEGSKIFIPVFSKDYANSEWCLLEIAQIFQRHRSNHQKILSIYFKVVPNDVQNQEGSFKEAFLKHEKNFEPHIVEGWREALREIGKLRGEVIDKKT
ncbi:hypothetical protein NE237_002045 [Protea cynaroides]|uniref:ADP-ribosyl cyclase/cyclic ADP-ribose hydrolase n=1 Tax=Protea cynaroides TaxID=273540 RepID=A0A9Q0KUP3_9MAGN|nr:hypothetical protein NE237_002045 [Protea cynaroides]